MTTRVCLIRHGETIWNAAGRWQGRAPVPLNEAGLEQSRRLAFYLAARGPHIDVLYSSDLKRAMQTAETIAAPFGLAVHPEPRLREVDLGDWQGLTRAEAEAWDGERYAAYTAARGAQPPPNGESWEQVKTRARLALDDLVARHTGQTLALVSHGGTVGRLIESLFGTIERPTLSNTSMTIVERAAPSVDWELVRVAWSPHLSDAPLGETW
jgi:broad specificity phosphatase PhoE